MSDATLSLTVLGVVIVLFVWNRLPVEVVALGSAIVLYATGVISAEQVFSGFGDPVVLFIAGLFVVSTGLTAAGVTTWAGQQLAARAGSGSRRLLVLTMVLAAAIAALITVNGAVAALLPMVVMLAVRSKLPPSRLVMPLAFAAHAGSLLVLTGTPINVLVSEAAADAGADGFGFFSFALVGLPLVAGTVAVAVLFGDRLLPGRTPSSLPPDLSRHARTMVTHYGLEQDAVRLLVPPGATALGSTADALAVAAPPKLTIVGVVAASGSPRGSVPLRADDVLIVHGPPEAVEEFGDRFGLQPLAGPVRPYLVGALVDQELGVAETVISPRSALIGAEVFPGMATDSGDLVILAVQRKGHDLGPEPCVLAAGDTLLLRGPWQALKRRTELSPDVLVVDSPAEMRRQVPTLGADGRRAILALVAMVGLLASGAVPPAVAALLAGGAMILMRVLSMADAYDGVAWTTLVIAGGMFPMSAAIQQSGAAGHIADLVVSAAGGNGYLLLAGLFLVTAVLGQLISNMATALIVIPIAVSAAADVGISVRPVLMCVAVAAAAALLTPVATPANLMVMGPGGYRFGDYWKFGLPVLLWFMAVALLVVPLVWPL